MRLPDLLKRAEDALKAEFRPKLPVFLQNLFLHWNEELEQWIATGLAKNNTLPELVRLQAQAEDISDETPGAARHLIAIERELQALLLGLDQRVTALITRGGMRRIAATSVRERAQMVSGSLALFVLLLMTKGVDLSQLDRHSRDVKPSKSIVTKQAPQPESRGESASLLSNFRAASEADRSEFVQNLSLEERGELFSQFWSSAPPGSKLKLFEKVQGSARQELFDIFQRIKEEGYQSYLFGTDRPTIPRLNQWLRQHAQCNLDLEEKPFAARAINFYREHFQAALFYEQNDEKVECTLTTELRGQGRSARFIVRERGNTRRTLLKQAAFPPLSLEK